MQFDISLFNDVLKISKFLYINHLKKHCSYGYELLREEISTLLREKYKFFFNNKKNNNLFYRLFRMGKKKIKRMVTFFTTKHYSNKINYSFLRKYLIEIRRNILDSESEYICDYVIINFKDEKNYKFLEMIDDEMIKFIKTIEDKEKEKGKEKEKEERKIEKNKIKKEKIKGIRIKYSYVCHDKNIYECLYNRNYDHEDIQKRLGCELVKIENKHKTIINRKVQKIKKDKNLKNIKRKMKNNKKEKYEKWLSAKIERRAQTIKRKQEEKEEKIIKMNEEIIKKERDFLKKQEEERKEKERRELLKPYKQMENIFKKTKYTGNYKIAINKMFLDYKDNDEAKLIYKISKIINRNKTMRNIILKSILVKKVTNFVKKTIIVEI